MTGVSRGRGPDAKQRGKGRGFPGDWAGLSLDRPRVMGILNVTPDSFSDGGEHHAPQAAIEAGRAMAAAGADIIDIGGETTNPDSRPTPPEQEQQRILPVIRALAEDRPISVDTRHAATMAAALDAGARIVNDVSALRHDPGSAGLLAGRACPVILMHMRGEPSTMNQFARYRDVALEVVAELGERIAAAEAAGIDRRRIAIDPGIGFAKNGAHNLSLLRRLPLLKNLGCPIMVGVSRKRFIGRLADEPDPRRRGPGSLAAALYAVARGASILRVHDVQPTVQALQVWQGLATADRLSLVRASVAHGP